MSVLEDIFNLAGPFAEAFAQQLVAQTAPESKAAGAKAVDWVREKLLGTKTTADDTLILGNLKAFMEGALEAANKPAPTPTP